MSHQEYLSDFRRFAGLDLEERRSILSRRGPPTIEIIESSVRADMNAASGAIVASLEKMDAAMDELDANFDTIDRAYKAVGGEGFPDMVKAKANFEDSLAEIAIAHRTVMSKATKFLKAWNALMTRADAYKG